MLPMVRPHVVDLSFIVTCAHQKIKALFCHINFDYAKNVKKWFVFLSTFFLLNIKKKRKIYTKLDQASKFTLTLLNYSDIFYELYEL